MTARRIDAATRGSQQTLGVRRWSGVVGLPLVVVLLGALVLTGIRRASSASEQLVRAYAVQQGLEQVNANLGDAELAHLAFAESGDTLFFTTFERAAARTREALDSLRRVVTDPRQSARLAALDPMVTERLSGLEATLGQPLGREAGSLRAPAIRDTIAVMHAQQAARLSRREAQDARANRLAIAATLAGTTVAVVLALITLGSLLRHSQAQAHALGALEESEERFRATFDQAAVGVAHVAMDGQWLRVNGRLCAILGYSREELLGMRSHDVTHPEDHAADVALERELIAGAIPYYQLEKRFVRKDGGVVWIGLTVSMVRATAPTESYFICVVEDIAERRRAEEALREAMDTALAERARAERSAERMRRLQEATAALSAALVPAQVADVVVTAGIAAVDASAGFISILNENEDALELIASRGYAPGDPQSWALLPLTTPMAAVEAARTGEAIWIESPEERALRFPEAVRRFGTEEFRAWASLPLAVEGRRIGVLSLSFPEPRTFAEGDRRYLLALAQQCAQAIERARLYREAQAASEAKSGFMAVMSHELRTPLNAIIGYAELLLLGIPESIPARAADQVTRLRAAAQHLLGLIEEILSFSRLEAGHDTRAWTRITADEIAAEVAMVIEPLARARGLVFSIEVETSGLELETDPVKIRQVLINLLGNAVKFTDRGRVTCTIAPDGSDAVFTIRDTGIGIAPEHLGRIFEPFWQAEAHPARRVSGTGLGLSVTQRLLETLGGKIAVESARGEGTTFRVRIPLAGATAPESPLASTETAIRPA